MRNQVAPPPESHIFIYPVTHVPPPTCTTMNPVISAAAQPRYVAKDCGDPNGVPQSWKCGAPASPPAPLR